MSSSLTFLNPNLSPAAASAQRLETVTSPPSPLESKDLLRGNKTIGIVHNGALYRLQATKLGKLILTK